MKRRTFLSQAAGVAAAAVASPAIAQSGQVRWRMTTSWPKTLDTIHGSADLMSQRISQLTDGKFQISVFPGGELVPGTQAFDAVSNSTVECGHTLSAFYVGKNPAYAFDSGVAFGANSRQQAAWLYYGGGLEILREVFRPANVLNFPCGNTGVQMGGWFRKEINTVEDLKGLRMRIGGMGGNVLSRLGVTPTQIPTGEIYPSLERGTIDAAEWIGPYDDEKLGFAKVAEILLHARLVGGLGDDHHPRQCKSLGSASGAVQGSVRGRRQRAEHSHASQIRCGQSGGAAAADRRRHSATRISAAGPRGVLQSIGRDI